MAANLIGQLINKDTIAQLAKGTKADETQVESLLSSALPLLMQNIQLHYIVIDPCCQLHYPL